MSGFDLSNYKTVPERMTEALEKYPMASLQSEVVELPGPFADKFIAVKARFFRWEGDTNPGEGLAWELVPGKTPYTKDSELMNAETSAWGRAIIAAFAADAQKGIASREEVEGRRPRSRRAPQNVNPETGEVFDAITYAREQVAPFTSWTPEQVGDAYKALAKALIGGKATTKEEIDQVVKALAEEYYDTFPDEAPFVEIEGQEALDV